MRKIGLMSFLMLNAFAMPVMASAEVLDSASPFTGPVTARMNLPVQRKLFQNSFQPPVALSPAEESDKARAIPGSVAAMKDMVNHKNTPAEAAALEEQRKQVRAMFEPMLNHRRPSTVLVHYKPNGQVDSVEILPVAR